MVRDDMTRETPGRESEILIAEEQDKLSVPNPLRGRETLTSCPIYVMSTLKAETERGKLLG